MEDQNKFCNFAENIELDSGILIWDISFGGFILIMSNLIFKKKVLGIILILIGSGCVVTGMLLLTRTAKQDTVIDLTTHSSPADGLVQSEEKNAEPSLNTTTPYFEESVERTDEPQPSSSNPTDLSSATGLHADPESNLPNSSQTAASQSSKSNSHFSAESNEEEENHVKGLEFEKYVVGRFGKKHWSIKEWRSDKSVDGRYVESSMNPDLEMRLKIREKEYIVAIECKWRTSAMKDGKIKWSYPDQLKRYQTYAKNTKFPVFVAIGVGGTPSHPAHLYLVPLTALSSHIIPQSDLTKYEISSARQLFYDPKTTDFKR